MEYVAGSIGFYIAVWVCARTRRWWFATDSIRVRRLGTDPALDVYCFGGDVVEVVFDEFFGGASHYDAAKAIKNEFTTPEAPHSYLKYGLMLPLPPKGAGPALVVDVGANIGLFSLSCVQRCKPSIFASHIARQTRVTAASAAAADQKRPLHIVAFEPIPTSIECAARNLHRFLWAPHSLPMQVAPTATSDGPEDVRVQLLQQGIADRNGATTFAYAPTFSAGATLARDEVAISSKKHPIMTLSAVMHDFSNFFFGADRLAEFHAGTERVVKEKKLIGLDAAFFRGFRWLHEHFLFQFCRAMLRYSAAALILPFGLGYLATVLMMPVLLTIAAWYAGAAPGETKVECAVTTLPEALRQAGVVFADEAAAKVVADKSLVYDSIDFLKIDVEGAEELIVKGILGPKLDASRPDGVAFLRRVRQCVIEVHDTPDGRVRRLASVLREVGGFPHVHIDVEPLHLHKVCQIATIFARRE